VKDKDTKLKEASQQEKDKLQELEVRAASTNTIKHHHLNLRYIS
jgi:hypothetical protein